MGPEEESLLENDPQVHRLLSLYLIIFQFLEPVHQSLCNTEFDHHDFRLTCFNSKNIMSTFLLQLLDGSFAYLKFTEEKVVTTSRQCAEQILDFFFKVYKNPFTLLEYAEERICYRQRNPGLEGSSNIFLQDERLSLLSIAMLFHLVYVENIRPLNLPSIYCPRYLVDQILRLVTIFFMRTEENLQYKGIQLGLSVLEHCHEELAIDDIDNQTSISIVEQLEKIVVYSTVERNRKEGIEFFTAFIKKHSIVARHQIVEHLFNTAQHDGLKGFVIMRYKDLVVQELPSVHNDFKKVVLQYICKLSDGEKTDLMDKKDSILAAMNFLLFLVIRDQQNDTAIWDFLGTIENSFLQPLRRGIDLSRAHYKEEYQRVQSGPDVIKEDSKIEILNGLEEDSETVMSKERTLDIISGALNTFDIMDSLLARINECISIRKKSIKT